MEDDYTLRELGVDEAKIFVNVVAVAGVAFALNFFFAPITVVGELIILACASGGVWGVDKVTDFESNLLGAAINAY
ncbi:TPA: hypothetical protein ACX6QO_001914 [Photobacterium damselae]